MCTSMWACLFVSSNHLLRNTAQRLETQQYVYVSVCLITCVSETQPHVCLHIYVYVCMLICVSIKYCTSMACMLIAPGSETQPLVNIMSVCVCMCLFVCSKYMYVRLCHACLLVELVQQVQPSLCDNVCVCD